MKVSVSKTRTPKGFKWVVSRGRAGKRRRAFFDSKAQADAEAVRWRTEIQNAGEVWVGLSAHERSQLIHAYSEAKKKGLDMLSLIQSHRDRVDVSTSVSDCITELITAKTNANRATQYTSNLRTILDQFSKGREPIAISAVTLADIETWLDSKNLASRPTLRSRLSTLFKFAVRRGYRLDNPCTRLESVTVPKSPPRIFTIAETKAALKWLAKHPKLYPWFVLSTFCGLRPEEAEKTTKKDVHVAEGWIKVEAQTTKVRQRRIVYPKLEALALLRVAMKRGKLPIKPMTKRRERDGLAAALRLDPIKRDNKTHYRWPKDVTRHTAASYWLADSNDAANIAHQLGHSESVLKRNYKALVTQEQARQFWECVTP